MDTQKGSEISETIQLQPLLNKDSKPIETKVKVALRVRPMIGKEIASNEQKCITCDTKTNQVFIGKDRAFTFDKVFDDYSPQNEVYEACARDLVLSCFKGYNATILAYGQTGSGKTFTMGSATAIDLKPEDMGIIPRTIREIFQEIEKRKNEAEFIVKASFLEIYNEEIQDLLDATSTANSRRYLGNAKSISIREEKDGSINVYGIVEEKVTSSEELSACLERGSLHRSTGSTLMNETSSRSHGIFTIFLEMHKISDLLPETESQQNQQKTTDLNIQEESEFMTAKFHFVDLAGSERLKKTGATGSVMREGININRSLLSLGNVIAALTEETNKYVHVPYRDSKLTRILQDSLGGNSCTYMIACVSPAESNFEESLNSLKYASRARNIKNKPVVNRDPQSAIISQLKQQIYELQSELIQYKKLVSSDPTLMSIGLPPTLNKPSISQSLKTQEDMNNEIIKNLKLKLLNSERETIKLKAELQANSKALNESEINLYSVQRERDLLKILTEKYKKQIQDNGMSLQLEDESLQEIDGKNLFEEYTSTIEKLKNELNDKDKLNKELQMEFENVLKKNEKDNQLLLQKTRTIASLKSQLKKKEVFGKLSFDSGNVSTNLSNSLTYDKRNSDSSVVEEEAEEGDLRNEDDERIEKEFEASANLHKRELHLVDGHISEKEALFNKITQSQIALERNLVEEMKNQYHTKVHQLEAEIKVLEKQRNEALSRTSSTMLEAEKAKIMNAYKQKMTELENKLKEYKKKDKDQANLMKLVQNQQSKLEQLADEIKKIKSQKIEMHKKMREEQEKFEKWRSTRQRELVTIKKKNQEKDAEISKLKSENRKKDELFKKRTEEILANFMSAEMIKHLQPSGGLHTRKNSKFSRNNSFLVTQTNVESMMQEMSSNISEEDARNLLDFCLQKIFENLELHFLISKEEEALQKSEQELEEQQHKHSIITLQKDKLEMEREQNKDENELDSNVMVKIEEMDMQLTEINTRIETQEEKISFLQNKIQDLSRQLNEKPPFDLDATLFKNEKLKNNIQNYQLLLRLILGKFVNANIEQYQTSDKLNQMTAEVSELRKKLEEAQQKARLQELQYELDLTKLHKEYEEKQYFWMRQSEVVVLPEEPQNTTTSEETENSGTSATQEDPKPSSVGFTSLAQARINKMMKGTPQPSPKKMLPGDPNINPVIRQKNLELALEELKRKDKKINDMTRKQQNSDKIIETLRRKCELLQEKYDHYKKTTAKEKFIGIEKREELTVEKPGFLMESSGATISFANSLPFRPTSPSFMSMSAGPKKAVDHKSQSTNQSPYGLMKSAKNMSLSSFRNRRNEKKEKAHILQRSESGLIQNPSTNEVLKSEEVRTRRNSGNIAPSVSSFSLAKSLALNPKHAKSNSIALKNQPAGLLSPSKFQPINLESPAIKRKESNSQNNLDGSLPNITGNTSDFEGNTKKSIDEGTGVMNYNNNQWKNVASFDAQSGIVYSAVSFGNMIYTASNKVFKVWSVDTRQCISEVNAHSSMIKSMTIWPEKNLLVTACEKTINLWDLLSLQNVGTLRGHKDDIRTLHIANDLLISAGKGSPSYGALLTWDLRNLSPLEEREKNQDIFCLTSYKETLFYGNRNHQVRRINLNTMEFLSPFEPPHFDVVTSLSIFKGALVSGSRDKNLRIWDLQGCFKNLKNTSYAHQDWVNIVQGNSDDDDQNNINFTIFPTANPSNSLLYSGSRDGSVKVWGASNYKLSCVSDIPAHSGSVNSICSVGDRFSNLFATASSDNMVKIWKFDPDEVNALSSNKPMDMMMDDNIILSNSIAYGESPNLKPISTPTELSQEEYPIYHTSKSENENQSSVDQENPMMSENPTMSEGTTSIEMPAENITSENQP